MNMLPVDREAMLADRALGWSEQADEARFAELLANDPRAERELAELEHVAWCARVALRSDPMPPILSPVDVAHLAARLEASARLQLAARTPRVFSRRRGPSALVPLLPWTLAAASLALLAWVASAPAQQAPIVAREALLRSAPSTQRVAWQPGPSPRRGEVRGDVVWNAERQEGYLRLEGLPPLDPQHRYQLWIVDAAREGPPVDGGLFEMPRASGAIVLRVDARLPVREARAFVVTIEPADGVVVSDQQHVVAIASF